MKLYLLFLSSLDRNLKPKGVEGGFGANNKENHNCLGILQVYARHSVGFNAALVCAAPKGMVFFCRFGLKTGIDFAHFGLESGMVYEGFTVAYK